MIDDLKPYRATKDSGVGWLGGIPTHWEVRRLRAAVELLVNGVWGDEPDGHDDLVCVRVADFDRTRRRVLLANKTFRAIALTDRHNRLLRKGDLLLEKSGGGELQPVGAVVLYEHELPAVCSNFIGRIVVSPGFDPGYLTYLHSTLYSFGLNVRSIKQTTGIQNLDSRSYLSERVAFPPLTEQRAIIRFLDHADNRIQRYIRAKENLIALLEEQKQATIHQAVTGQINVRTGECYTAYKDSGVEWLGEVPEHWDVRRLGQIGTFSKGSGGNRDDEVPEGVPCIRYGDLYTTHKYFIRSSRSCVPRARAADYTLLRFGDLLFAGSGETMEEIGKSAVNLVRSEVRCGGDIIVFRANREVEPEFLGYATDAPSAVAQKATMGRGFTVMHIYAKQLKRLALAVPPLAEQIEIARFLNDALARIDAGMVAAGRQIRLARELRSSVTADVVTGKLDVREAANTLPGRQLTQHATSVHANP